MCSSDLVQSTLATIGQAAGTAAAMCVEKEIKPHDIYEDHITELQQTLLKCDQTIPGLKNEDPKDLARNAKVTVSSKLPGNNLNQEDSFFRESLSVLADEHQVIIPLSNSKKLSQFKLYIKSKNRDTTMVDIRFEGLKNRGNHVKKLEQFRIKVAGYAQKWFEIPANITIPDDADFLRVELPEVKGILWPAINWMVQKADPVNEKVDHKPENIVNDRTRINENKESLWISDPLKPFPQWIELDLGKPKTFNTVHLTFDTDRSTGNPEKSRQGVCVKSYKVSAFSRRGWVEVAESKDNFQRHRIHKFDKINAGKLRLEITATRGAPSARLFEIRIYNEP